MNAVLYFTKKIHLYAGKRLYLNLLGSVVISLMDYVGIFLLIPLISITGVINMNSFEGINLEVFHTLFSNLSETSSLILILSIYLLIMISQGYFSRLQMISNMRIQQGFTRKLSEETNQALLNANWGFYLKKKKSDLLNMMTTELSRVSSGTYLFLQFLSSLIFTFVQISIAFFLSIELTTFVLLFGIALIFFMRTFIKKTNEISKEALMLNKKYLSYITDQLNGIKDIKSNLIEEGYVNKFNNLCRDKERNIVTLAKIRYNSQFLYKVVSIFLIVIFVFFSIRFFKAQAGELILILMIFSRLWPKFIDIQTNMEQLASNIPSFKSLHNLQRECEEAIEFTEKGDKIPSLILKKGIECNNVSFRYNQNELFAVRNINVFIPANKMTAVVGQSGAGKSTLIDILLGLNIPEYGEVLIDGEYLHGESLLKLRKSISYVPQDPFLFNTTIRENMLVINPNANEEEMWEALRFASAEAVVRKLPNSLDTVIGDRGIRLSGGERQRIVLARAILKKPSVLVLDEATSSLDSENEVRIQEAIELLSGKMTIIVIAHRLSTIRNADQVIVLEDGKIIQQGRYKELSSDQQGIFASLLGKQMSVSH